jgi:hypothetical protein
VTSALTGTERRVAICLLVGACLLTALLAQLATTARGPYLLAALVAAAFVVAALRRWGRGVWYGLLVIAAVNGLPGPNLDTIAVSGAAGTDIVTVLLILSLVSELWRQRVVWFRFGSGPRLTGIWSVAFLLLWAVTVARSYVFSGIPLKHAVYFGRAFAYFAILIPLFAGVLMDSRVRNRFVATGAIGAIIIALTQCLATVGGGTWSAFVHVNQTLAQDGITRLYTDALELVVAAFALAVGGLLLSRSKGVRSASACVLVASTVDIALSLTRALYVGAVLGVVAAVAVWLTRPAPQSRLARRQLTRIALACIVGLTLLVVVNPPSVSSSAINGVSARVVSVFDAASTANPAHLTVAIREQEASVLEQILGSRWPFGLGFLDNRNRYFTGLPTWDAGSIMDTDVGVLNVVMTMGVLGAIMQYFSLVAIALLLARRHLILGEPQAEAWLSFGVFTWIVLAIASSVTLTLLFNATSVVVSAAVVGLGASLLRPETRVTNLAR